VRADLLPKRRRAPFHNCARITDLIASSKHFAAHHGVMICGNPALDWPLRMDFFGKTGIQFSGFVRIQMNNAA